MNILNAKEAHINIVKNITYQTIKIIYPHYYTAGVVKFFLNHHKEENIINDIKLRKVFLITNNKIPVGTVTINENEICRLFVLPEVQGMGFGTCLMDFAENKIWEKYNNIRLDSSLAAQNMYLKRGYNKIESCKIKTEQDDFLYYDVMYKKKILLVNIRFEYTDGHSSDFISLCHNLDNFLNEIVGGEENRAKYIPYNGLNDINDVIIAYDGAAAVGCASFKKYDDKCAEVKRVFIKKEYRGHGISNQLMMKLETAAKNKGYISMILESGELLAAAMALYKHIGYEVIPNYGQYKDMADSICMKKDL